MKQELIMTPVYKLITLIVLIITISCDRTQLDDSNKTAEKANDEKFRTNEARDDADFIVKAVANHYTEIKLAKVAEKRSANQEVKAMAHLLERDYEKSLLDLKAFAEHKVISLPVEEKSEERNSVEKFRNESGKDFDKKWCREMIHAHEDAITQFEKRMEKSKDSDIKALANKTLPNLRTQIEKLHACYDKLNKK
jgi:putative membrane protein